MCASLALDLEVEDKIKRKFFDHESASWRPPGDPGMVNFLDSGRHCKQTNYLARPTMRVRMSAARVVERKSAVTATAVVAHAAASA